MNQNDTDACDSIDRRTRRALTEPLTVLAHDETPVDDAETTIVTVTSASGSTYDVDVRSGACSCPDSRHRDPEGGCKHVRRARAVLCQGTVDAETIRALDVDPQLGAFAPGPRVATADGGVVGGGGDGATVVEDGARWKGPFQETDKYGELTGAEYVRCSECGVEVLADETRHATHRDGCDGVGVDQSN